MFTTGRITLGDDIIKDGYVPGNCQKDVIPLGKAQEEVAGQTMSRLGLFGGSDRAVGAGH